MEQQYTISLGKCTGLLIYGGWRTYEKVGTYEELKKEYNKVQRHNKIWGWWFGLLPFANYRFIKSNKAAMAELDRLHSGVPTPIA